MSRQQNNIKWQELLLLLNEDPDWQMKSESDRYKRITELGRELFQKEKLPGIDKIDEEKYLTLKHYGYPMAEIAKEFHVSKHTLYRWKKEKGYINKRKREEVKG